MTEKNSGWFEERMGLKKPLDWFLYRKVPRGVNWWYVLGSATMAAFTLQVLTGLFLMLNYSPSPDHAYDSIKYMMTAVPFGSLIRSIHFYAASAMVILVVLHLLRVYFMAAYKYPRELTWIVGAVLLILVLGASFTGYLLPWDQRAYWATNVAAGIASQVPLVGPWIQKLLIGGTQIGALTLTRFFTFHIGVVPILIAGLIAFHVSLVIKQGISGPPQKQKQPPPPGKDMRTVYQEQYELSKKGGESFFPDTVAKDAVFALFVVAAIIILAAVFPHASEAPADPTSTTYNPSPEWYFLFFFQFLKLFPGWLEPVAAVLVPLVAIAILIAVPFLDRGLKRFWAERKTAVALGGFAVVCLAFLEVTGALSAPTSSGDETSPLILEGQRVYRYINCAYCHSINGIGGAVGPDLSNIAATLSTAQITSYLKNPDSMVPNTLHPKLQFTPEELNGLVAYLGTLGAPATFSAEALSIFQKQCQGCHVINGKGGDEGPDLSTVGLRHPVSFFKSFISNPKDVVPGSSMPAFHNILTPEQIADLSGYLSSLKGQTSPPGSTPPSPPGPGSPAPQSSSSSTPATAPSSGSAPLSGSQLYTVNCASCHGTNRTNGYAPALTQLSLARMSDSAIIGLMQRGRGGMPPFAGSLTAAQMNAILQYIKTP